MDIKALAREIRGLDYVVMRNWETMPPRGDIDFFVDTWDYDRLRQACIKHLGDERWFDIRMPGDDYYSREIEHEMLFDKRFYAIEDGEETVGFWIPSPQAHFLSLYYHQLVHKGDPRYQEALDLAFWDWMKPKPPKDKGVGFHDPRTP